MSSSNVYALDRHVSRRSRSESGRTKLAEQNELLAAALSNMPHGLCMLDSDARLILCNPAFATMYRLPQNLIEPGTTREAILAHGFSTGQGPISGVSDYLARSAEAKPGQSIVGELALADGRTIRISHTPIENGGYVATHEDITDRIAASAKIEFLAYRDTLTGLPNRTEFQRSFDDAVQAAERDGEMFGVIMIDVDHFKDINDTLGHDAGDALLLNLAKTLGKAFRRGDTVSRLGGDEFAVVLRGLAGPDDLLRPIEVLQTQLRKPVEHAGRSFTISASLGAAIHDDPDADPLHLLKNADVALYEAKSGGRNRCVIFKPSMRTQVEQRIELLREVRLAIAQGEFDLYYQPVVDLEANRVAGFEALMRWNHPEQGVLPPAAFMAAFEDTDLSLQLGEVAFERALGQMRAWIDEGVEFGRVAVNISSEQFRTGRLAKDIAEKLAAWKVPADKLTIEVTENVYMGWGADVVAETVCELHAAGVLIALDDFGTGYASLANLRQFPVDRLKIDKSFVQNVEDDAIVRAVINLGASMGMKVVAEGVEKPEQLAALTAYGCDQVQGYHFAKPMPAAQVAAFVKAFGA
ncbi:putative bifunctional diguanylate cyclase/phosphodiesterase [Caulobacter hibisci]|uniref:EAL domain-containing protein n=1 Tax=Caulobacter hibisci TaxID=2035993 RepID=A0ABS0SXB5_9CAUL|nr:EAL domain-containing protein [Caulobacter hibisci]MBI1684174.1 EAL domain-containing protein [Caulobacter hibisci]